MLNRGGGEGHITSPSSKTVRTSVKCSNFEPISLVGVNSCLSELQADTASQVVATYERSEKRRRLAGLYKEILELWMSRYEAIFGSTVLYKRANQGSILFDERLVYVNDWKFYLDLAAKYEFYHIDEPLAHYRIHPDNTWGATGPDAQKWRLVNEDIILLREYIVRQYPHRLSAEAKAIELEKVGSLYFALGQNRKALMSFFRAFIYSPARKSNLHYPRYFFRLTRNVLARGR